MKLIMISGSQDFELLFYTVMIILSVIEKKQ